MERCRFHPRVVRISRIIDVPLINDAPMREELLNCKRESLALRSFLHVAGLFLELAADRHANLLARVNHAARQRPNAGVTTTNGDHLQGGRVRARLPARHYGVCCMIRPPFAEHSAIANAGTAARIHRTTIRVKEEVSFKRRAILDLLASRARISRIGPAFGVCGALHIGHDTLARETAWSVLRVSHTPVHLVVGHLKPLWILRVLLAARDHVHASRLLKCLLRRLQLGSKLFVQCSRRCSHSFAFRRSDGAFRHSRQGRFRRARSNCTRSCT
mmetsp:Transcript_26204/g.79588  ORF Transcript_26204/g.79588 Transcript_26204/m.79588 type:complete len:273 (+) Transcript_26204:812-1630(+)